MNVVPFLGVTIQRPCDPVSASRSMFRSKSFMLLSDVPLHAGSKNAAHTTTSAASNSQPTNQPPCVRIPGPTQDVGLVLERSTEAIGLQTPRASSFRDAETHVESLRDVVTALAAALLEQPEAVDARGAVERLRGVVQAERRHRGGGERLHLDAGAIHRAHRGPNADRPGALVGFHHDLG